MYPRMHASIYVRDLKRSVDFYSRWWGKRPDKERPGYAKYELSEPGLIFSMVENPERASGDFGHLGIQVESSGILDEWKERAIAAGLDSREEKGVACCYAIQDKFWLTDPDGVQWEVYYFHEDVEWNDPRYEKGDAENQQDACCSPSFSVQNLPATAAVSKEKTVASTAATASTENQPAETLDPASCTPATARSTGCC